MATQAVIYSRATGRVRRVVSTDNPPPQFLNACGVLAGEAALQFDGSGDLNTWQAAVTQTTLLVPANDRYCVIDPQNKILSAIIGDILCGDSVLGCRLVPHPSAGPDWTYDGVNFLPPVLKVGQAQQTAPL